MRKIILLLIISVFISSCGSYKVKNQNENIEQIQYQNIEFVQDIGFFSEKKEVGDFNVVDFQKEWGEIKPKLLQLAKDNYANAIVIEKFEMAGTVVKGKLYQVDSTKLSAIANPEKERKLYIFRDELGSLLTTNFKTELSINGETGKLQDRTFKAIDLNDDQNSINIAINGKSEELELTHGTNFFWISRQINASQFSGTGVNFEVGGQKIMKIRDNEMGQIWISTLK